MASLAPKLATYDDLLGLQEDVRAEVIAGQILVAPSPLPRHSRAQRVLGRFVGGPYDDDDGRGGPGGWWIFIEVDVQLGSHDIVRPDLAGWRRTRLPHPGAMRPIDVAPDWVCEVISPSAAARDRVIKRDLYARHRIPHYWLVDPEARTLEALELTGDRWVEIGAWDETASARIAPFADVELEVGRLFLPREAEPTTPER
jgi:Uma2 family endonuclease